MSRRRCHSYSAAVKADILALCQVGGRREELVSQFGVGKSTIRRWLAEVRPPVEDWVCQATQKCRQAERHEHCRRCGVILDPVGPREYRPAPNGLCCWCIKDAERHPDSSEEAA